MQNTGELEGRQNLLRGVGIERFFSLGISRFLHLSVENMDLNFIGTPKAILKFSGFVKQHFILTTIGNEKPNPHRLLLLLPPGMEYNITYLFQ